MIKPLVEESIDVTFPFTTEISDCTHGDRGRGVEGSRPFDVILCDVIRRLDIYIIFRYSWKGSIRKKE